MPGFGPGLNGGAPKRNYTREEISAGLMALVAHSGSPSQAMEYLRETGQLDIGQSTLSRWKTIHAAQYDEIREKYSDQVEQRLAHNFRENAALAIEGTREAIDLARERLESKKDPDPGRTAANLAKVSQTSTDKLLSLTGRPSRIVETRGLQEILRSLAAKGILALPEGSDDD